LPPIAIPLKLFKKLPDLTSRPFKTFRPDCIKIAQKPNSAVKTGGPKSGNFPLTCRPFYETIPVEEKAIPMETSQDVAVFEWSKKQPSFIKKNL